MVSHLPSYEASTRVRDWTQGSAGQVRGGTEVGACWGSRVEVAGAGVADMAARSAREAGRARPCGEVRQVGACGCEGSRGRGRGGSGRSVGYTWLGRTHGWLV
jgi:hypothetical protein